MEGIRQLIRTLKADGRFRFVTYSDLVKERCTKERILHPEDMQGIHNKLQNRFWPVMEPVSLSIADIFAACVKFLGGAKLFAPSRVYGFLDMPYAISTEVTVNAEDVKKAAEGIDLKTFLPTSIEVGGIKIGPADFLYAMLDVLDGKEEIAMVPREQNIDLSDFPGLTGFPFDKWIFSPEFKAEILKKRAPLQAWTIRF